MSFANKTVLITGATGTLGRALSFAFRKSDANLVVLAKNESQLKILYNELNKCAGNGSINQIVADLSNPDFLDKTNTNMFITDILINNAATQSPIGLLESNSCSAWLDIVNINLVAPVFLCRTAIPRMKSNKFGRIINISGGGAAGPRAFFSAYSSTKAALVRLTETLACELQNTGVTVNAIAPGAMLSAMTKEVLNAENIIENEELQRAQWLYLNKEDNTAAEAVDLCLWLASDASNGITGRLISAKWDNWKEWPKHLAELQNSDLYTLRRITGRDRGQTWGDK
ncbi:MAG: SDR family oxidoreductase [Holosporaceae bacterium]|jgi:3-oxoacyl-[acyl-carrier protein] reductase|nr:SDR family oxidoreductase [Holosporaceae bacterium]